jgi:hypothetical protein
MADYTRKPSPGSTTSSGPRAAEPSPGKHTLVEALPVAVHFHQETWVYDAGTNTVTVNNTMRRASVR